MDIIIAHPETPSPGPRLSVRAVLSASHCLSHRSHLPPLHLEVPHFSRRRRQPRSHFSFGPQLPTTPEDPNSGSFVLAILEAVKELSLLGFFQVGATLLGLYAGYQLLLLYGKLWIEK
jgi:hypothetical protein